MDKFTFKRTPERVQVIERFDELQKQAEALAEEFKVKGRGELYEHAAHRALNAAQGVINQKSLLAQQWEHEDAQGRAS